MGVAVCLLLIAALAVEGTEEESSRTFKIDYKRNTFVKDGKPFRYVSGSVHYFRSLEDQWEDILGKVRLGGLNAITTYVEWSLHQKSSEPKFDFDGNKNLFKFLEIAQENDLLVILRPGPYIDAERDMGGLPAWLLWEKPNMTLRSSDLEYVYFVSRWFDELLPRLEPYLYHNGGPIISVQVENEYGSYGCDREYTTFLRDLIRLHLGPKVVLFTTDGAGESMVQCGSVDGVHATVDFGPASNSKIIEYFEIQRTYAPKGPLINSEFYPGWLDHWQRPHSKQPVEAVTSSLNAILGLGANVNFYMYHGGTSFGFGAGANLDSGVYDPNPTSYDYDAPLTESGDPTPKYYAIREIIGKYLEVPTENATISPKANYGKVSLRKLTSICDLEFQTLFGGVRKHAKRTMTFEELKVSSGFVLYQARVSELCSDPVLLAANELRDRAYVYVDKSFTGVLSRQDQIFSLPVRARKSQLISILVENQGRVCFGHGINETKGLGRVTLGNGELLHWDMLPMGEFDAKKLQKYGAGMKSRLLNTSSEDPYFIRNQGAGGFYSGEWVLPQGNSVQDTFVNLKGFSKGVIWVNGFNLGRYWPIVGPQITLYLPGPLIKPYPEKNTFLVMELEQAPVGCSTSNDNQKNCHITLQDKHIVDGPTPYEAK